MSDAQPHVSASGDKPRPHTSPVAKTAAISSIAVMGSRLLGLVREQAFAYFFGASREYDAFLTAFRIPNLLRDLLAEGALSTAFVTVFSRELSQHGKPRAFALANSVINALALLLLGIVALGIVFAPTLVGAMAIGFDSDKAALTVLLTRIMFGYIFFAALSACCMGMLNAQGKFGLPQSASSFFNLTSIITGLLLASVLAPSYMTSLWQGTPLAAVATGALWDRPSVRAMVGMAIGTLLGGLVQWLVQVPLLIKLGWRYRPHIDRHEPGLAQVLRLMAPAVIGAGAVQLSVFVNSNFASTLGDRPISWLAYSFRLMQFPIGVFGVAVMSATLPLLSRHAAQKDLAAFGATLTEGLELVLCLTTPAALGLAVAGEPILRLIFEHGRFGPSDTHACAQALAAYALGLPAYSALKVVQPAFVAQNDARTPMLVSITGVGCSILLNTLLLRGLGLGHVGLASSTSLMAIGSSVALLIIMERRRPTLARAHLQKECVRVLLAAGAMALTLKLGMVALGAAGFGRGSAQAALELALLVPLAAAVYVACGRALGISQLARAEQLIMRKLRRRRA